MARLRPTISLLHTSDLHVTDHPSSADGLAAAVDLAVSRSVDAVLIAGDLFDHSRVGTEALDRTLTQLSRLTQPTVVIPGNHDQLDERSVYHRFDVEAAGDHVVFVGEPEGRRVFFDGLCLAVWARGIADHHPGHRPLDGYERAPEGWWDVVLTHGHYVANGEASDRSSRIGALEIEALRCDYVALGHWHRFVDLSTGGVPAYYSGSPSLPDGDVASVVVATLDETAGLSVERAEVPTRSGIKG